MKKDIEVISEFRVNVDRRELFRKMVAGSAVMVAAGVSTTVAAKEIDIPSLPGTDYAESHDSAAWAFTSDDGGLASNGKSGHRWAMLIDLRKCVGCQSCTVACKFENNVPDGVFRTLVADIELERYPDTRRGFLPRLCNHCERPSCVEVCPAGATWQRQDGIVVMDYGRCVGCGSCVGACPYDARFMNPVTGTADKCNFCAQRVDQGLLPACVETCVGGARQFGDLADASSAPARALRQDSVQVLKPQTGNQPSVFYIGLPDALQNNIRGVPDLWSQQRIAAGKVATAWQVKE